MFWKIAFSIFEIEHAKKGILLKVNQKMKIINSVPDTIKSLAPGSVSKIFPSFLQIPH